MSEPIIHMENIEKHFGNVIALAGVAFDVSPGECHCDVVFITHNVRHSLAVGNRFTVLNWGNTLGIAVKGEIEPGELQDLMAGGQKFATLEGSPCSTI